MNRRVLAFVVGVVLAVGLMPGVALAAADGLQAAPAELTVQASKDLGDCSIKWTGSNFAGSATDSYQFFYAKGKKVAVTPTFDLYYGSKKVPTSAYSVSYQMTYYNGKKDVTKKWSASNLIPSGSPEASKTDMSTEYRLVITAKSGSGYTGTYSDATVVAVDLYNTGRNADLVLGGKKWRYNINPMNANYYVIPQSKAKATLNSLKVYVGREPGEGGMTHKGGTKLTKDTHYTVTYYKAKKNVMDGDFSPASSAKTGSALKSVPTTPGSYVCIVKGKSPYYGTSSFYFDIQGSASDLTISKVAAQTENGSYLEPALTVKYKGTTLTEGVDYDVTYANNLKAGTATATITGTKVLTNNKGYSYNVNRARYFTGSKKVTFKIKAGSKTWQDNPMTASAKTITVKASTLQSKGDQTIATTDAFTVAGAQGKVTYEKVSGPSILDVSSDGKVTVTAFPTMFHKGETYSMKVRVLAKGTSSYYAKAKTVTLKVKIG